MIGGNLAFGMGDGETTNQHPAWEIWWEILRENLAGKSCGKILRENLAGQGAGEKANLRKTVIGGNLAFGIG